MPLLVDESFRKLSLEDNERILEEKFCPQTQCFHLTSWVLRHQGCCLFHRSFCLFFCFFCLSVLRKLSFPTLPWSVAWCFGQRIGWQDLDWKSMGFDNSLSGSFSFVLLSITGFFQLLTSREIIISFSGILIVCSFLCLYKMQVCCVL